MGLSSAKATPLSALWRDKPNPSPLGAYQQRAVQSRVSCKLCCVRRADVPVVLQLPAENPWPMNPSCNVGTHNIKRIFSLLSAGEHTAAKQGHGDG